jgi:hypothetical protein
MPLSILTARHSKVRLEEGERQAHVLPPPTQAFLFSLSGHRICASFWGWILGLELRPHTCRQALYHLSYIPSLKHVFTCVCKKDTHEAPGDWPQTPLPSYIQPTSALLAESVPNVGTFGQ